MRLAARRYGVADGLRRAGGACKLSARVLRFPGGAIHIDEMTSGDRFDALWWRRIGGNYGGAAQKRDWNAQPGVWQKLK